MLAPTTSEIRLTSLDPFWAPERVQRIANDGFTRAISLILDDAEKDASR